MKLMYFAYQHVFFMYFFLNYDFFDNFKSTENYKQAENNHNFTIED